MSTRVRAVMVLVCTALAVAGCGGEPAPAQSAPTAGGSASMALSPAPAASPTPSSEFAALLDRAKAATIAPAALRVIGISAAPKSEDPKVFKLSEVCRRTLQADADGMYASYRRIWSDQGWWVRNTAHAYASVKGADVIAQVKAAVESCKTYTDSVGEHTLLGPVQLPKYPGSEAGYGYCQNIKDPDDGTSYVSCVAFVAKENLVSSLWVIHGSTQKTNTTGIVGAGSIAAETLAKLA